MSYRKKIAVPMCIFLVSCLMIGVFAIGSLAADQPAENEPTAVTMDVAAMDVGGIAAPNTAQETLPPQRNVTEADENPESAYQPLSADSASSEEPDTFRSPGGDSGYSLTDDERIAVECAVMCEAGGEGEKGQMMVAQSILDGSLRNDFTVMQTINRYQIASTAYYLVSEQVKESVSRVFDDGERVTEEKTDLWYNPALVVSAWHEQQQYVITVGSHRFFWMNDDME
ncbi:MAG: hypothetical protein PUC06_07280 [Oscillospiraceae bacterium]|nr:hypothetical protein [Oscillospiraceae bacterium]